MERITGCVKWFNNKTGYGFIRDLSNEEEIFVHHTALSTVLSYKYLVQGEYVEFEKGVHTKSGRTVAISVTGVKRGKLMCETRAENQPTRDAVPDTVVPFTTPPVVDGWNSPPAVDGWNSSPPTEESGPTA